MLSAADTLLAYGTETVALLQSRVKSLPVTRFGPVNASGNLAASLRCEVSQTPDGYRLSLYAAAYALALEYGRKPGAFPNLLAIKQWIADKGIVPHPDAKGRAVSTDSLAFLIGRKIQQQGTTIFQAGQPSQLFGALLSPEAVQQALLKLLLPVYVEQVRSVLRGA